MYYQDFSNFKRNCILRNGSEVLIRAIHPQDLAIEKKFVENLSEKSKYYRFMGGTSNLQLKSLEYFTHIDYKNHMALIATTKQKDKESEIAVARYISHHHNKLCEFAIVVADQWQHQGLAYQLMKDLIKIAKAQGFEVMEGFALSENHEMIELAKSLGFDIRICEEDHVLTKLSKVLVAR
ncbi:MAG: GNAT family N-acetyltransferase [Deltaproteobacteria bacterium]|nr:GNAT family N-acetyltransferase [Deltaproteobacteria bacterium]